MRPRSGIASGQLLLSVVTVASGVGAAFAHGAPTGLPYVDTAMRVAVGVTLAALGAYAAWGWLLVASAVAVATSAGEATIVPAGAAAVVSLLGSALSSRSKVMGSTVLRATGGALVAQAALRGTWPRLALGPSLCAAVAILLIVVSGMYLAPRRTRNVFLATAGALAVAAIVLTLLGGAMLWRAKAPLEAGLQATEDALQAAKTGLRPSAISSFTEARDEFRTAEHDLSAARAAEFVPGVSQQVRAVRVATAIGVSVTTSALETVRRADIGAIRVSHGAVPVGLLASFRPILARDTVVLRSALDDTSSFRSPWIVAPLATKLKEETSKLRQADRDARLGLLASESIPQMLGRSAPQRYLILFENPAESRASGGIIGDYAEISADEGRLSLTKVGSVAQLNEDGDRTRRLIGPADYLARYARFEPQYFWQNVPMSPDFPSVAKVAANLFPQSGGGRVDGVVSLDPQALAALLQVTGPISVAPWPISLTPADATAILAHFEFIHFSRDESLQAPFVQAVVRQIWKTIVSEALPAPSQLASDVSPSVRGRDIMLYSANKVGERLFSQLGVSGAFPQKGRDFLAVMTQNAEGNKIDWYLRRTIRYHAIINKRTRQLNATVAITLHNLSPSSGLPPVVIDPSPGAPTKPGESELYLSVYSPWRCSSSTIDGRHLAMQSQHELGRRVYSAFVTIPPRGQTSITLHLRGRWSVRRQYRLHVFEQPLLFKDRVVKSVTTIG